MKTKKLILATMVILLAGILLVGPAMSGVSKTEIVITRNEYTTVNNVHRVVAGSLLSGRHTRDIYTRFTAPDARINVQYGTGVYTQEEIEFMQSIYTTGNRVNIFIDLTGMTWGLDNGANWSSGGVGTHGHKSNLSQVFQNSSSTEQTGQLVNVQDLDPLTVLITITNYFTTTNTTYQITDYYCESPLILDLDKNGKLDTAKHIWQPHAPQFFTHYAKFFDITGDGTTEYCEWVAPNTKDGFLVMPENGKVMNALQMFGTAGGYDDGFNKLAIVCDKDGNGWIEGAELEGLKIWIDENQDAIAQEHELKELSDFGVVRISTKHENFVGSYQTSDGQTHTMWDWWPTMAVTRKFRNQ